MSLEARTTLGVAAIGAIAACLASACGPVCYDMLSCRELSLAAWCSQHGTCTLSNNITILAGDAPGSFGDLIPNSEIRIPLDDLAEQIRAMPALVVVLRAGAPLAPSAVLIEFDGLPAHTIIEGDSTVLHTMIDIPSGAHMLLFRYAGPGLTVSHGLAQFDLDMHLKEVVPCTGMHRACSF